MKRYILGDLKHPLTIQQTWGPYLSAKMDKLPFTCCGLNLVNHCLYHANTMLMAFNNSSENTDHSFG